MKYIEKIPYVLRSVLIFALGVILLTLFNFIDFFGNTLTNILIYILFFILLTLNCIKLAKKSKNKGLIVGIKVSSLVLGIWIIFKLILKINFNSFMVAGRLFVYKLVVFLNFFQNVLCSFYSHFTKVRFQTIIAFFKFFFIM